MQALETEMFILKILVNLISMSMLQFHLFVFGDNRSLSSHEVINLLSIFNSADHSLTFNNLLELIKTNFVNLIGLHGLLKEPLHFISFHLRLVILWCISSLLNEHLLVDFVGRVFNDWNFLFFVIWGFVLIILSFCVFVGSIGHDDKNEEEDECEDTLIYLDLLISKHDPEPDVSPQ